VALAPVPSGPFQKVYDLHEGPTDALVVCCADNRFLDAIDDFLEDIGVENPAMIAVPGSVKSIGLQMVIPKQWHTLRHQLELMAQRNAHVPRVILFTHEECRSYAASVKLLRGFTKVFDAQRDHLLKLAKFLASEYLPSARIELYHAAIVPRGSERGVQFQKISA
jgi:carbonic anhydrase